MGRRCGGLGGSAERLQMRPSNSPSVTAGETAGDYSTRYRTTTGTNYTMKTNRDLLQAALGLMIEPVRLAQLMQIILPCSNQEFLNTVLSDEEFEEKFKGLRAELPAFKASCIAAAVADMRTRLGLSTE